MTKRVNPERLEQFLSELLGRLGSDNNEASIVANHLVNANLRGHDSHGAFIIDYYKHCLDVKTLVPNAPLELLETRGAALLYDGNRGFGQRLAKEAIIAGIDVTRQNGVAVVGLRNCHHVGRVGTFCEQAADAGLVSLMFVNALEFPPRVTPLGGKEARLMTNPMAFGFPRGKRPPLVMDFATSAVAFGKVEVAKNKGIPLPPGCIVDGEGLPSTDPNDLYADKTQEKKAGAILPFGGHKGYGLMLFCELLAGALTGGETARAINEHTLGCTNNLMAILINPGFLGADRLAAEAEAYLQYVTDTEATDPNNPVMLPGDLELQTTALRREQGIEFDDTSWAAIEATARSAGVNTPLTDILMEKSQ